MSEEKAPIHQRMASKSHFPETQPSEIRKKVHVSLVEAMKPQLMQNAAETQSRSKYNLRKSLAWDSAFSTSPGVLDTEELFETLNFRVVGNELEKTTCKELNFLPSEHIEDKINEIADSCNMRMSLAWDSEFLTSPGVLDAEELCIVSSGFRRSSTLPGIKDEEMWKSAGSNSTVISDSYSLASLEIDLFDDMTTSMDNEPSSNVTASTCKLQREKRMQSGGGLTPKMPNSSSFLRSAASSGYSNPLLSCKPLKISKSSKQRPTTPIRKASLVTNHAEVKIRASTSAAGKNMTIQNKASRWGSRDFVPDTKPSAKNAFSVSPFGGKGHAGCSCASTDFSGRSLPNPLKRTAESGLYNPASTYRTPPKCSSPNKSKLLKSVGSTCSLSTPNSSSRTSPASSVNRWPLQTSSTTLKQRPNKSPFCSLVTSPCGEIPFEGDTSQTSDMKSQKDDERLGDENRETGFMIPWNSKTSRDVSPVAPSIPADLRSSGLRMTSPKLGFFDAEDSLWPASKRGQKFRSGAQTTLCKSGISISNLNGAPSRSTFVDHRLAGNSGATMRKQGTKSGEKLCLRKKRQLLEEHKHVKVQNSGDVIVRINEENKENVAGFGYQVNDLTKNLEAIGFI